MLTGLQFWYHSQKPLIHCASSWLSFHVIFIIYSLHPKHFKEKENCRALDVPPAKSRGICQVWHWALPCALGMLPCLHYCHTGQESCREGPSGASVRKHAHTPRFALQHRLSSSQTKPSRAQAAVQRRRSGRLFGSDLGKKGKVNRKTSAAISSRGNFEREEAIA